MSGNKVQTQNLPDIPSPQDIVEGKKVTQAWREWFYVLRLKVNSITGNFINLIGLTGTGLLVQTGTETYANRKLVEGANITITNPDGVAGDITIAATGGGGGGISGVNTQTAATYTIVLLDANKIIDFNLVGTAVVTIPLHSSVAFLSPTTIYFGSRSQDLSLTVSDPAITLIDATYPKAANTAKGGYLVQVASDIWYLFGNIIYLPYSIFFYDGSTLTGWTVTGAVTIDSILGNPPPSMQAPGGTYAIQAITGLTNFSGKTIYVDIYIPSTGTNLTNFFFGCSSSGAGYLLRVDGRSGSPSGIIACSSWSSTAAPSTGPTMPGGTWVSYTIVIDASNNITVTNSLGSSFSSISGATFSGTYIGCVGSISSVTGGNYDNIRITSP